MSERLREAREEDLGAIDAIYNHYVLQSDCTLQTEPSTLEYRRAWFAERKAEGFPVLVLEREDTGAVLGWGCLMKFNPREGYRLTAEDSVYLRQDVTGRGYGRRLLEALLERADALGLHRVIAKISATQTGSLALHERCGFVEQGRLNEVGQKFGRWVDVVFLVRRGP